MHSHTPSGLRSLTGCSFVAPLLAISLGASLLGGCLGATTSEKGQSGSGGTGGGGGTGGSDTGSSRVEKIAREGVDKIDILFVVDNSVSMTDKQEILSLAAPNLIARLVEPHCVDADGRVVSWGGECAEGSRREFSPIPDVHVGVISSSLGSHGAGGDPPACSDAPPGNDRARLIPTVRPEAGLTGAEAEGFLSWRSGDSQPLFVSLEEQIRAAGDRGCGYEATLESWYRFLIDPEPPLSVGRNGSQAVLHDIDQDLLAQRAAFLRHDSLLAVIMLTDENDCSIQDSGAGVLTADLSWSMPAATSICETDPNDECCSSCALLRDLPAGCDPAPCTGDGVPVLPRELDRINLRCFEQKRRFGLDLLYPTQRYVDGLALPMVPNRAGEMVRNPIYEAPPGESPRNPSLVFLAGIVGVPWQLIATDESLDGASLQYLTSEQIDAAGLWPLIVGRNGDEPTDPHMMESIDPRPGLPTWEDAPDSDPIHGHEYDNNYEPNVYGDGAPARDNLQYACIFPLTQARECEPGAIGCDCSPEMEGANSPLCDGTTQTHAKAYPGTRHLEVLQDFGRNSIVASVCPKHPASPEASDLYAGYQPAMTAIGDRLGEVLQGRCLGRELPVDASTGRVTCRIVETAPSGLDCTAPGRAEVDGVVAREVRKELESSNRCGLPIDLPCEDYDICEIVQLAGDEGVQCLESEDASLAPPGFCYVDPDQGFGSPVLVEQCPPTERRLLRFTGDAQNPTPAPSAEVYLYCD